jgi:hypothetical protein
MGWHSPHHCIVLGGMGWGMGQEMEWGWARERALGMGWHSPHHCIVLGGMGWGMGGEMALGMA